MRLRCDELTARRIADLMVETFDPAEVAAAAFEESVNLRDWTPGAWVVEVYFGFDPDQRTIRDLVGLAAETHLAEQASFATIDQKDWVASSLAGLKPVRAGRFLVHGSHDRGCVAAGDVSLEIEAALAFGTGHHGSTRGCLLLFDRLLKRRRPRRVLDVGCGSGVLALAAAKTLRRPIACGDIDPVSVAAALANARLNDLAPYIRPLVARGAEHPLLRAGAPYDLLFANILAQPLRHMAPRLCALAGSGADLILSGLLGADVAGVLSAYEAQGFRLSERLDVDGWASLRLRRGGAQARTAGAN